MNNILEIIEKEKGFLENDDYKRLKVLDIKEEDLVNMSVKSRLLIHSRNYTKVDFFERCENTEEIAHIIKIITLWELDGEYGYQDNTLAKKRLEYLVLSDIPSDWLFLIDSFEKSTLVEHIIEIQDSILDNPELEDKFIRNTI